MYVSLVVIETEKGPRIYRSLWKEAQSIKLTVINIKKHRLASLNVPTSSIKLYNLYIPYLSHLGHRIVL